MPSLTQNMVIFPFLTFVPTMVLSWFHTDVEARINMLKAYPITCIPWRHKGCKQLSRGLMKQGSHSTKCWQSSRALWQLLDGNRCSQNNNADFENCTFRLIYLNSACIPVSTQQRFGGLPLQWYFRDLKRPKPNVLSANFNSISLHRTGTLWENCTHIISWDKKKVDLKLL